MRQGLRDAHVDHPARQPPGAPNPTETGVGTDPFVARRNDWWRLFDFVWMLHIMDYETRDDFNHPLLIATAATALLFVVSGLFMLFFAFRPRRSG